VANVAHPPDRAHVLQSAQRDRVGHARTPFQRFLVFSLVLTTATCAATGGIKAQATGAGLARPENQSAVPRASIQFDSKGVEFGPWVRDFIARIRSNWFVPAGAMTDKGHVVVTFYVHKNGAMADLQVVTPSLAAFNGSAYNAVASSNPFAPLPQEYPDERAFFTITFYFNESPPKDPEVVPMSSSDTLREQSTAMTAQTLTADNAFVVQAVLRQSSTTAPLTLIFSEPFMQGKKRMVRRREITIPASDVIDSLTMQVRSSYPHPPSAEFMIVLNVRGRNIPATTSDPLVFTLASGTVIPVPQSAINSGATAWLRPRLSGVAAIGK
jgi:TonB family protein